MNNKLLEMKRKMLQKQQQKDKEVKPPTQQPVQPSKAEPEVPKPENNVQSVPPQLNTEVQQDKAAAEEKVESSVVRQEAEPAVVVSKPAEVVESPPEPVAQDPKQNIELPPIPQKKQAGYELEDGEEPPEEGEEKQPDNQMQEPNLQIQDKQPNLSCSVDEDPKSQVFHQEEAAVVESKQDKKQRKIILKELQLVKKCVRNLKQSLKGLQIIQKKIQVRPQLKYQLQEYLQQIRAIQAQGQTS